MDAAIAAVLSEMQNIFPLKEEHKKALEAFLSGHLSLAEYHQTQRCIAGNHGAVLMSHRSRSDWSA